MSEPCLRDECCQLRKQINEHWGPENTRLARDMEILMKKLFIACGYDPLTLNDLVPLQGTGQGDLQMVLRWQDQHALLASVKLLRSAAEVIERDRRG